MKVFIDERHQNSSALQYHHDISLKVFQSISIESKTNKNRLENPKITKINQGFPDGDPSVSVMDKWIPTVFASLRLTSVRPRQNGRHFADDIFNRISLNENICIPIKISLKFVPNGPINNIPALIQIMAWRRPGDKPLSEPRMVSLPTHICVTRPQWTLETQLPVPRS